VTTRRAEAGHTVSGGSSCALLWERFPSSRGDRCMRVPDHQALCFEAAKGAPHRRFTHAHQFRDLPRRATGEGRPLWVRLMHEGPHCRPRQSRPASARPQRLCWRTHGAPITRCPSPHRRTVRSPPWTRGSQPRDTRSTRPPATRRPTPAASAAGASSQVARKRNRPWEPRTSTLPPGSRFAAAAEWSGLAVMRPLRCRLPILPGERLSAWAAGPR